MCTALTEETFFSAQDRICWLNNRRVSERVPPCLFKYATVVALSEKKSTGLLNWPSPPEQLKHSPLLQVLWNLMTGMPPPWACQSPEWAPQPHRLASVVIFIGEYQVLPSLADVPVASTRTDWKNPFGSCMSQFKELFLLSQLCRRNALKGPGMQLGPLDPQNCCSH